MAANDKRVGNGLRGQSSIARNILENRDGAASPQSQHRPAIERSGPTVNSVTGALDDAVCHFERLRVLFASALGEMHELTNGLPVAGGHVSAPIVSRFADNWLICEIVGEKLVELETVVGAICEKAHTDRREQVA